MAPNAFLGWRTYVSVMINYQPQIICVLGLTLVIAAGDAMQFIRVAALHWPLRG